jgi:hypothetical protein
MASTEAAPHPGAEEKKIDDGSWEMPEPEPIHLHLGADEAPITAVTCYTDNMAEVSAR